MLKVSALCPLALLLLFVPAAASAETPDSSTIEGRWHTPDKNGTIEIYAEKGALYGKLVESKHPKARLGTIILRHLVRKGDAWVGKLYAPKKDKLVDAKLVRDDDKLRVKVSAGFFSKTIVWTRAP